MIVCMGEIIKKLYYLFVFVCVCVCACVCMYVCVCVSVCDFEKLSFYNLKMIDLFIDYKKKRKTKVPCM